MACIGLAMAAAPLAGCGDDDTSAADERADQVLAAARAAGVPEDAAEVLALAARGSLATYRVTYAGTDGAELIVSQAPPDQRVDVVAAGTVVESRVLHDGIAYRCELDDDGALGCERAAGGLQVPGAFTEEALETFTDRLAASLGTIELTVEERTIADTEVRCLTSAPKAGTPIDEHAPPTDTICVSPEGVQLLLDAGGERLVADTYTTDVPEGTFEV